MSYFTIKEFDCQCGQDTCEARKLGPHVELVKRLTKLREALGKPIIISSGLRCPEWNRVQGGKLDSAHLTGQAADLSCGDSQRRWQLLSLIFTHKLFVRVGIGDTFLHVDINPDKQSEVLWLY